MESASLVPLAPGINDTEALREEYFEKIMNRFESVTKQSVKKNIIFKSHFARTILFQNIIHTKGIMRANICYKLLFFLNLN
jgi:hypothetical protein